MNTPSEITYAIAKFWPLLGGFGALLAIILPRPLGLTWLLLVLIASSVIVIRGAQAQQIDAELIRDRKESPPRFSLGFYVFAAILPFTAFALLAVSFKAFAAAFAFLSVMSLLFFSVLDFSTKRVVLTPIPSILISLFLLHQYWGFGAIFTYFMMLIIMAPKAIECSIRNRLLLSELQKANQKMKADEK